MSCSRRWSVRLLVIALVAAVAAGSLMDTRRYVDRHPAAATKPHDDLLMVPLSIGVVTTLDSVELCLHRGDRLGVTQYRLVGAQQLVRPSVRPTLTEPVVVRAVAGERIITAADSLPVAEWRAPAAWEAPAATAYPPRMLPVPQYAVLLACSLGEDYVLDISIRNFTQLIEAVKDDESEWHTVFHGSVANVFTHDTITAQLERAEEKLGMDSERRADAKSRQAFERLVISLLASAGDGGENEQTHHHGDEHDGSDVNNSASSAAMVRRVGEESLRMLLDTVGTVQVPHFWEGVERALRKKVPFDDENDDESTVS